MQRTTESELRGLTAASGIHSFLASRRWLRAGAIFGLLLLLSACTRTPAAPTAAPTRAPTPTLIPFTPTPMAGCSTVATGPTPEISQALPAVTSADYARGPAEARVTLLAYCDFQSAQCEIFNRALDQLEKDHPDDLRIVLRPFPVPSSVAASLDKSQLSVQAAIAAGNQGKFWEMRDLLHGQYSSWVKLAPAAFRTWIVGEAPGLGLDGQRFAAELDSAETVAAAKAMFTKANGLGIASWPTVFINGALQPRAAMSYDGLNSAIGLLALAGRQFKTCPPFAINPSKEYVATVHTAKGDIVIQLFADKAPLAVNSFVFLARQGWFDGVTFHRVIPGFVAQAGDPSGTGMGGPGYYFENEIRAGLGFDRPGVVAMANAGPDTNGSQFFITYTPQPRLTGSYTIFGQVLQGMEVVEALTARDASLTTGLPPGDKILRVTVQEK